MLLGSCLFAVAGRSQPLHLCLSLLAVEQISFYADLGSGVGMPLMKFLKPLEMVRPCAGKRSLLHLRRHKGDGRAPAARSPCQRGAKSERESKTAKSVRRRAPWGMPAQCSACRARLSVKSFLTSQPSALPVWVATSGRHGQRGQLSQEASV